MAFDITLLDVNASGSKGRTKIHTYQSADSQATIQASGYFNAVASVLATGDLMYVFSTSDVTGVLLRLSKSGTNVMTSSVLTSAGSGKIYVPIHVLTLVGANIYRAVAPVAGTITKIWAILETALATGDATLTPKITAGAVGGAGTAMTGGLITITQAGSAAGDVDSSAPSALNVVAAGDQLSVLVGGTNTIAAVERVLVEITQ
jgi:hypothetical protein